MAVREVCVLKRRDALRDVPDDCPLLCVAGDRRVELLAVHRHDAWHAPWAVGSLRLGFNGSCRVNRGLDAQALSAGLSDYLGLLVLRWGAALRS